VIVIVASALIDALLDPEKVPQVQAAFDNENSPVIAPSVIDLEVAQTFRRMVRAKEILPVRGASALRSIALLPLERVHHINFMQRIWELRDNATAYDAAYIALAEHLEAPIITTDRKFEGIAAHMAKIILI
jgi:predicted nucleic acid-binding protein